MTRRFYHRQVRGGKWSANCENLQRARRGGEDSLKTVSLWEVTKEQGGRERKKQPRFIVFPLFHLLAVLPLASAHQARWQRHLLTFSVRTSLLVPRAEHRRLKRGAGGTNRMNPKGLMS